MKRNTIIIAAVALLLSSIFYSDEDRTALHTLVRTQTFYAVALDAALIGAVLLLAPALASLFLNDPAARAMTAGSRPKIWRTTGGSPGVIFASSAVFASSRVRATAEIISLTA